MDKLEACLLVIVCLSILAAAIMGSYDAGHQYGYYQGAKTEKVYFDATGNFPTREWLKSYRGRHLDFPQQIIDTLNPY